VRVGRADKAACSDVGVDRTRELGVLDLTHRFAREVRQASPRPRRLHAAAVHPQHECVWAAALVPGAFGAVTVDMAKIGSVAFGNGPVILPILQQDSLAHHWLTLNQFGAGIAFGQATPGPFLATRRSSGSQRLAGGAAWPPGWPSSRPAWR
jgi:hypothetical protein